MILLYLISYNVVPFEHLIIFIISFSLCFLIMNRGRKVHFKKSPDSFFYCWTKSSKI